MSALERLCLTMLMLGAACVSSGSDDAMDGSDEPDDMTQQETDKAKPTAQGPIPLELWVDDLVDHHSDYAATPDTVHDKNISDTEDPALFEKYFVKQKK